MNSDDFTSPASPTSPSASNSAGRRIRVRSLKRSLTGQEASLPSIPSDDNDWVSPFTLPPLPALRKNRTHLDRSPEDRQHDRSGSSAYYAAAWGSPYATPSPNHSPASRFTRNKSLDLHSSPLVDRSASRYHTPGSAVGRDPATIDKDRSTSLSPTGSQRKSQRRNWLSESDDSASDNDQLSRKTPRQRKHTGDGSGLSGARSHNVKASVDTITPETFNGNSGMTTHPESSDTAQIMAESQSAALPPLADDTTIKEKPLPNLPTSFSAIQQPSPVQSRPPLSMSAQSFQRPKKKVPWKGKSCIIAMPLTDREQAGLLPVMSRKEIQDRIQMWIDQGYPVHGFNVGDWYSSPFHVGGASRPTYPDFADMDFERKNNGPSVRIPNQKEWEDFMEYLREEKLRALGVTPSTSEAPPSTHSPFSSTISRVSSAYPSISASPPIPSLSVASSHPRMGHSPFSPSMSIPAGSNYFSASNRGTPGLPNGARPMHGYTQSIAIPGMGQRINSPFEYPISQPYGSGMRSPAEQMGGRRSFTPGHVQNMQSMGHILSPVNLQQQDFARSFSPSNPHIEQIRRQQEALAKHQQHVQAQILRAQHQRQMSMFPMRTMSTEQLPTTPKIASPEREPPEIMHPTPRSHRHNLSAALEKGVTDSVAASSKGLSQALNGDKSDAKTSKHGNDEAEEGEIVEEEEEDAGEELPILHRPETIKDADDKTEVETNPSIAGTPLLLDDKNPFSSFKPLPPPETTKRPGFGHAAQPSLSRFNVQAKEFNPSKSSFAPNPFNFDGNAFADRAKLAEKPVSHAAKFSHKHNPSSLGLNVAAPVFTPVFAPVPAQPNDKVATFASATTSNVASAKSSFDANLKSSVFNFASAEKAEFSTPAKPSFNPASAAFNFTGGSQKDETPQKSETEPQSSAFSFRSANFNVEAPEFKPMGLSLSSIDFTPEKPKDFTNGTIFSDVVLDPSSKPNRRPKALPIVKPESREATPVAVERKEEFDAEDRLMAPSDRNKRARHVGGDDEKILFADSAPFKSLDEQHAKTDDTKNVVSEKENEEQVVNKEPDIASTESAVIATKLATVLEEPSVTLPVADTVEEKSEPEVAHTETEDIVDATKSADASDAEIAPSDPLKTATQAALQEDVTKSDATGPVTEEPNSAKATPPMQTDAEIVAPEETSLKNEKEAEIPDASAEDKAEVADAVQPQEDADIPSVPATISNVVPNLSADAPAFIPLRPVVAEPKPAFSPFAQPFEFKPVVKEFTPVQKPRTSEVTSHDESAKPKKGGLMASRFASSPPPAPAAPTVQNIAERQPSPPAEMAATPQKHSGPDNKASPEAEPVSATHEEETVPAEEAESNMHLTDPASILARFREEDSRTGSVMSRPGDLSYEEINAVMKQFEDDPDLGVIREDTPVKSTPLVDMRYPHNFRSDAPSPSPRRLDRPFNRNQQRPYGGLGFDISGVHQLNFGTPQIDDWNAELSPGQQDKLEARAHFFDDHVNDLVDNVLESRLAPLERTLQSIQHSVQQVATKPRASRRSSTLR